jgi:hypothetical protein
MNSIISSVLTLLLLVILGVYSAESSGLSSPPPWPTAFGPTSGSSTSPVIGPKAGPLQCNFLNKTSNWTSRYILTGSPLLLSGTPSPSVIVIGQRISDMNYSLLSIDDVSGDLLFETVMLVPDSYSCGISSAVLDPCGLRAFVALGCGPEPLNLNNYIVAINLKDVQLLGISTVSELERLQLLYPLLLVNPFSQPLEIEIRFYPLLDYLQILGRL